MGGLEAGKFSDPQGGVRSVTVLQVTCYYYRLVSNYQLNAQFLYSVTIYMLHYNTQHVSSSAVSSEPAYCTAFYRD